MKITLIRHCIVLVIIVSCIFIAVELNTARAHSVATARQPSPGSRLAVPPKQVCITFGDGIEPAFSEVSVSDEKGASVAQGRGIGTCTTDKCTLDLPALAAGTYTVNYSVLSVDGHVVKSKYEFSVTGQVQVP